ncbi:MAG: hypothetical protein VKP62_03235 [Candidatus Sericytochromatia bacterium]|nr:hypothetical protein [Candidatus Sericytochromatia bacterium]
MKVAHHVSLATALTLVVLAGCQARTPNAESTGRLAPSAGGGMAAAQEPAALKPTQPANAAPALSSREADLAKAKPMAIKAAEGGVYRSEDGAVEVTIPPGALSGNTSVRFAPGDTKSEQATDLYIPGLKVAMDLGTAQIKAGKGLVLKSKVDARFVEAFKKDAPGVDPATRGLSQGPDGAWYLSMPVTPTASRNTTFRSTKVAGDLEMIEALPAAPGRSLQQTSGSPLRLLQASSTTSTSEPTLTPSNTGNPTIDSWPAMPVSQAGKAPYLPMTEMTIDAKGHSVSFKIRNTVDESLAIDSEYIRCYVAHGWCSSSRINETIQEVIDFNQGLAANRQPPADLVARLNSYRSWDCATEETVDMAVVATYDSDDERINGKPAADAIISTGVGENVTEHPVSAEGRVNLPVGINVKLTVVGSIQKPIPASSQPKEVTTAKGMADVSIKIPKMSPKLTVRFQADGPLPTSMTVDYKVNDEPASSTISITGAGTQNGTAEFRVKVPTDSNYNFTFTGARGENFTNTQDAPINQTFPVHRNGEYEKTIKVFLVAPK